MEEDSISFSHLIISLSTPLLTLPQISSDSNRSNEENTASVGVSDFKHVNAQSKEDARPDIESAQLFSDFVEKEADELLTDFLALLSIISTYQSSCTQSSVKYNVSDCIDNIQYDPLKKVSKVNVIIVKSLISKSH